MSEKSDYLKSYIGKKCVVDLSSWYSSITGTIIKCESGWMTLETRRKIELINIDRINRISLKR